MNSGESRPRQRIKGVAKVQPDTVDVEPAEASLDMRPLAFSDHALKAWLAKPGASLC